MSSLRLHSSCKDWACQSDSNNWTLEDSSTQILAVSFPALFFHSSHCFIKRWRSFSDSLWAFWRAWGQRDQRLTEAFHIFFHIFFHICSLCKALTLWLGRAEPGGAGRSLELVIESEALSFYLALWCTLMHFELPLSFFGCDVLDSNRSSLFELRKLFCFSSR